MGGNGFIKMPNSGHFRERAKLNLRPDRRFKLPPKGRNGVGSANARGRRTMLNGADN
jgi:hypothetical protein